MIFLEQCEGLSSAWHHSGLKKLSTTQLRNHPNMTSLTQLGRYGYTDTKGCCFLTRLFFNLFIEQHTPLNFNIDTLVPKQSLCDFPDAPGFKEGLVTRLPLTRADMVAKFLFTYLDGLPSETTRIVEVFDRCPHGFFARFLPIDFVKSGYVVDLGLETPFYSYISGVDGFETAVSTTSGYQRKSDSRTESVDVPLNGPTPGYKGLTGAYSGFFAFGTTRRRCIVTPSMLRHVCRVGLACTQCWSCLHIFHCACNPFR